MIKKVLRVLIAILIFLLFVVAPGLMGVVAIGFVAYIISDIVINALFGDKE